jgi:hypothetical protein
MTHGEVNLKINKKEKTHLPLWGIKPPFLGSSARDVDIAHCAVGAAL